MTTPLLIGRTRAAVALAREHGVTVEYVDGWTRRGRPGFAPRGLVEHCTSDPAVLTTQRMRQILRNGHGSLTGNALCNAWIRRDGIVEVLASGLAWHAGRGQWRGHSGNRAFFGIEYHRAQTQQILDVQLDAGAVFTWALCRTFGWPPPMVCDHREYAPNRKRDRHGVDSAAWRRRIAAPPVPDPEDVMNEDQDRRLKRVEAQLAGLGAAMAEMSTIVADLHRSVGGRMVGNDLQRLRTSVRAIADDAGLKTEHPPVDGPVQA